MGYARRQKTMKGVRSREERPVLLRRGSGAAQGPQKLWGIWCKILHSSNLETPNFSLKKFHLFIAPFIISHKMFIKDIFSHLKKKRSLFVKLSTRQLFSGNFFNKIL